MTLRMALAASIAIGLGALTAASAAASAAETEQKLVDAARIFPFLDKYYALAPAERTAFALRFRFNSEGKPPPPETRLILVDGAKRTPIPLAPDGRAERLPTAAEFAAKAQVELVKPKGTKISVQMSPEASIRPSTDIDPNPCAQAIAQTNAAISRLAGVMALVAPKIRSCRFVGVASGVAVGADGVATSLPVEKGDVVFNPTLVKAARSIRLSNPPRFVDLGS